MVSVYHTFNHFKTTIVQPLMVRLEQDGQLYDPNGDVDADELMRRLAYLRGYDKVRPPPLSHMSDTDMVHPVHGCHRENNQGDSAKKDQPRVSGTC